MIEEIISHYPQRHFVLVGDTGQKDPELYGQLASKHPDRVRRILLRRIGEPAADSSRFDACFEGVPREKWQLFDESRDLPRDLP
jgi:phosphatidate phosphatase APP1